MASQSDILLQAGSASWPVKQGAAGTWRQNADLENFQLWPIALQLISIKRMGIARTWNKTARIWGCVMVSAL
jgi:hypothetical protein